MNFSDIIKALNQASAFELYRMRAAIDRVLDESHWLRAVQVRLRVGQSVQYFDPQANALKRGQVLEMRRKQLVVLDLDDARRWIISYAAVNLDGSDVQIREDKRQGLGRNEVAIGEVVGFVDRDQRVEDGLVAGTRARALRDGRDRRVEDVLGGRSARPARSREPDPDHRTEARSARAPRLRGPFNLEARRAAGFDEHELAALTAR